MKQYIATGTCQLDDNLIPDERFQKDTPVPDFRFCSAKCQTEYKQKYPHRYRGIIRQIEEQIAKNGEA